MLQGKTSCELDSTVLKKLFHQARIIAANPNTLGFTGVELAMTLYACAAMNPPQPDFALELSAYCLPLLPNLPANELVLILESHARLTSYVARKSAATRNTAPVVPGATIPQARAGRREVSPEVLAVLEEIVARQESGGLSGNQVVRAVAASGKLGAPWRTVRVLVEAGAVQ